MRLSKHWTGCPELWMPHPWRCLRPDWMGPSAILSNKRCPMAEALNWMMFKDPFSPNPFCDSVKDHWGLCKVALLALVLLELNLHFHSAWWPGKLPSCRDKDLQHSPTPCPLYPLRESSSANREKIPWSGRSLFSSAHAKTTHWRVKMLKKGNELPSDPWTWCFPSILQKLLRLWAACIEVFLMFAKGEKSLLGAKRDSGFGSFCYEHFPSIQFISLMNSHL